MITPLSSPNDVRLTMARKRRTALEAWGRELALARDGKSLSQEELAKAVFVSQSLVAMWETGKRTPKADDLARCEEILGTTGFLARMLAELVAREVSHEWLDRWIEVEESATTLLWFEPIVVPGLLQTPDYARAILDSEELVATRLERQRVLDEGEPPMLVVLLSESVLRQQVGGAEVLSEQLRHLAEMARRRTISVQVVPPDAPACAKFAGHFVVASLDGAPDVAYVDNQLRGEVVEGHADVTALRRRFEYFRADALSHRQTIDLIEKAADQCITP
ncbi:Scr1 family TA system antitoxin-like transcriptional regulator [Amycolatopsis sp. NPDC059027]|uniref:helix-turn-helix domain-containing protein n=1 Tax=Amycolatopsis sp. NPDC059027 TaxID=3346709 RepID=UPI003670FB64